MSLKKSFKKGVLIIRKHSPEILMGVGVVSLVGAVGTAIWKTATCDQILDEHEEKMKEAEAHIKESQEKVEELKKDPEKGGKIVYTDEDAEADLKGAQMKVWVKTVGKIAWHYAPTIALTALSATSFLGAFCIVKGRYTAVAGALAATTSAFEAYRERVREDVGEDKDLYYRYGVVKEKVPVVDENGKKTKEKEEAIVADKKVNGDGIFVFTFDDRSGEFFKDVTTDLITLNGIRSTLDMDLQAEGYLLARDILKRLDCWDTLTRKQRNEAMKWVYVDNGVCHVDFDIYNVRNRDAIMAGSNRRCDQLILELKGLVPIDSVTLP